MILIKKHPLLFFLTLILIYDPGHTNNLYNDTTIVNQVNEQSTSQESKDTSNWDCVIIYLGYESYNYGQEKILNNSFSIFVFECEYKPTMIKWLKLNIIGIGASRPSHNFTPSEKIVLQNYEKVTTDMWGNVIKRESIKKIQYTAGRVVTGLKIYPLYFYKGEFNPFIGVGGSLWVFESEIQGVYERKRTQTAFNLQYRFGVDVLLKNTNIFLRIEYLLGSVPDFGETLTGLREIKGGNYSTFRIGIGIPFSYF